MIDEFFGVVIGSGAMDHIMDFKRNILPKFLMAREKEKEHFDNILNEAKKVGDAWDHVEDGVINLFGRTYDEDSYLHSLIFNAASNSFLAPEMVKSESRMSKLSNIFSNAVNFGKKFIYLI